MNKKKLGGGRGWGEERREFDEEQDKETAVCYFF